MVWGLRVFVCYPTCLDKVRAIEKDYSRSKRGRRRTTNELRPLFEGLKTS